jgi:hypothetical protein
LTSHAASVEAPRIAGISYARQGSIAGRLQLDRNFD